VLQALRVRIGTITVACWILVAFGGTSAVGATRQPDLFPKWSPDGSSIAFDRVGVVHAVNRAGSRLRRAEDARYGADFLAWFDWIPGTAELGILHRDTIFTTDGRFSQTRRASWWCAAPAFSRQGLLIAFPSHVPGSDCIDARFSVAMLNGAIVAETAGVTPTFSPDGRYVAFHRITHNIPTSRYYEHSTHVLDLQTGEVRDVLAAGIVAVWSPDGTRLAVVDTEPARGPGTGTDTVLYLLDRDGSGARRIGPLKPELEAYAPSWSSDGRWLAYTAASGARIIRGDGSTGRTLGRGEAVAWSPRRAELLVNRGGRLEVLALTGARRPIGRGLFPTWSPDGSRVAYVGSRQCGPRQGIWTVNAGGKNRRRLTNACVLAGFVGRDRIRGTPWRDAVHAYESNDVIDVRGGGVDSVACGDHVDSVIADRRDRISGDCERVTRR
jgi:dipeptidyl aminopeptidase/acylaminoacyl peptidase